MINLKKRRQRYRRLSFRRRLRISSVKLELLSPLDFSLGFVLQLVRGPSQYRILQPFSYSINYKNASVWDLATCGGSVRVVYRRMQELNKQVPPYPTQRQTIILFQQQDSSRPIYKDDIVIMEENTPNIGVFRVILMVNVLFVQNLIITVVKIWSRQRLR